MDYIKVGLFIKEKRINKQLTQQQLADKLYVDVTTVSKWERGVTFPDSGIITKLCSCLKISEHELFLACEDQDYRNAKKKINQINKGKLLAFSIISALYALAILICFITNLAVNHTLSWFFIVLTSCLAGWTFFPTCLRFAKRYKLELFIGSTFISLSLMYLSISIVTNNYWCFFAIIATLLLYVLFFLPFIFFKKEYIHINKKWFLTLYSAISLVLTIILLLTINAYISFDIVSALHITSYCFLLPILGSLTTVIPKLSKYFKASIIVFLSALFIVGLNGVLNYSITKSVSNCYSINFLDWNNYSNGNMTLILGSSSLLTAIVLLVLGIIKKDKNI